MIFEIDEIRIDQTIAPVAFLNRVDEFAILIAIMTSGHARYYMIS